jgi:hypothetical protein
MDLNTPAQNAQAVYSMEGKKLDVAQKQQDFDQGNQDQAALKEAMADPQNNLATPDGMANLLKTVQGKVTPKTLMGLADHAQKVKANDIALNESVMKMDEQARKNYSESFEPIAAEMDDVYAEYHQNLKTLGKETADKIYKEKTAPIVQKYAGVKLPNGTPLVPPALINNIQNGDVNMIDAMYANSQHVKNKLDAADKASQQREREAHANQEEAMTKLLSSDGPGKGAETYVDGEKRPVFQSKMQPEKFFVKDDTGKLSPWNGDPSTLRKIGSASEVKREEEEAAKISPENQKVLTDYALLNPLPHPSARLSPAAAAAWNTSLAESIKEAGGSKVAAMDALIRKADVAALRVQTTQGAAIENTARDIKFDMVGIEDELRKLDGPDSQKVRAILQTAVNDWEGGSEYSALKAYMINLQEQTGRLFSRTTSAGGTPVAFLDLAKELNNGNMNLKQFLKSKDAIGKLADWSLKSTNQEKETLLKDMEGHFKNSGGGSWKVDPKDQKARDSDAAKIISDEATRVLSDYANASPENRDRKWTDLKDIRKEQMRAGALQMAPGGPGSKAGDVAKGADGLHIFKGGTWNKKENWELLDAK